MPELMLAEVPIAVAWNVQGNPARAESLFEVALPLRPNALAHHGQILALWLGPRSWLLIMEQARPGFAEARAALNAEGAALFDLSASRIALSVRGSQAAAVLAKSCPLDFDPRAFAPGTCAQSLFAGVNTLFYRRDEAPEFVVMVARSFARDVRRALQESAAPLS